jgi:hypothetical protein
MENKLKIDLKFFFQEQRYISVALIIIIIIIIIPLHENTVTRIRSTYHMQFDVRQLQVLTRI